MTRLPLKYDGREAVTDFEPSTHEAELFPQGETEGHAVDLKLSTSQPVVHGPMGYQNLLGIQFEASDVNKTTVTTKFSVLRFVCKLLKSGVGQQLGLPPNFHCSLLQHQQDSRGTATLSPLHHPCFILHRIDSPIHCLGNSDERTPESVG
ncbi:unnamed protein product [Musa acuminata subsp. burmannicoides]